MKLDTNPDSNTLHDTTSFGKLLQKQIGLRRVLDSGQSNADTSSQTQRSLRGYGVAAQSIRIKQQYKRRLRRGFVRSGIGRIVGADRLKRGEVPMALANFGAKSEGRQS